MNDANDFPDLSHWKAVMEFTIDQAALLLAGIDPLETKSAEDAKGQSHPRWKKAAAHSIAIITAIRQGLISPVICYGWKHDWDHGQILVTIKHTDRGTDICSENTVITRASLLSWVESERVKYETPTRKPAVEPRSSEPESVTIEAAPDTLALPYRGHKSEGMEFVEEAINQFWATFDEDDPATAPTKEEVTKYLESRGATGRMAQAVDMILRPFSMRTRGLKNKRPAARES